MKLIYNDFALHEVAEFAVTQTREYEGQGDSPQRCRVTLKVSLWFFEQAYADNYALILKAREACRKQHAVLQWQSEDDDQYFVNQPVTITAGDQPEEWGQYHQTVVLTFEYYEQDLITQNLPMLFKRTGSNGQIVLENVSKYAETVTTERFSTLRSQRKETQAKVTVSGFIAADTTLTLDQRRAFLRPLAATYREQMGGAEGTLQFGSPNAYVINRTVRITEATAELDQLANVINFNFTATYTVFPDEANYATVDYTAEQKDGMTGEEFLTLAGKIQANTEAAARVKLASVVAAALAQYGYHELSTAYPAIQQLRMDSTASHVESGDGTAFVELSFTGEWRRWRSTNQALTFRKAGATGAAVALGQPRTFSATYQARRFNAQRSQRQDAEGRIEAAGTLAADPKLTLTARRTALQNAHTRILQEVNGADGTLVKGTFTQVCRVDSFKAEINEAETGIDWTLTATYSLFPNEAGYATAQFNVAKADNVEDGDEGFTFTGKILAQNGAAARAKLDTLRTSILALYGFTVAQRVRGNTTVEGIDANGDKTAGIDEGLEAKTTDGVSFLELNFSEEYRRRKADLLSTTLQVTTRVDIPTGLVATTYSGTVRASGVNASTAYVAAVAKAAAMGANKETEVGGSAFLRSSQLTQERRQTRVDNAEEFVNLSFTYEYQSKVGSGLAYLEVNTQLAVDNFGTDAENVSGYCVAKDSATAAGFYAAHVRNAYNGMLLRNETTSEQKVLAEKGGSFTQQPVRFDFSFSVMRVKGAAVAMRYSLNVRRDYLTATRTTTLSGSVFGASPGLADTTLSAFALGLGLGSIVTESRTEDRDYLAGAPDSDVPLKGLFVKLDFEFVYVSKLTNVTGLIDMQVTEEVTYSGTRWQVQQVPYNADPTTDGNSGVSVVQPCGIQEGGRTVRGTASAATRATAESWCKNFRTWLAGDANAKKYPQPEQWTYGYELTPRTQGVMTGVNANIQVVKVSFTFAEILPKYPPPA